MANPTWFNATKYLENKLAQLQATDSKGNWTAESLTKVLEANGYKGDEGAYKHFNDFGMNENVSPNASFDATFYLNAKAAQLNALNVDGKTWTAVSVMDAIKAAGMNSAWEHFDKFGSQEGISTSATFNTVEYLTAKTALMNKTAEGGRSNWTVDEVKAALAENGLNALEHYSQFGQAEFKAAGVAETFHTATAADTATGFDPYTGVQTYDTLADALTAQKAGSLAAKYAITAAADAGDVTVAQQAGLAALLAGATPAITTTATYHLVDTVAALTDVSTTVLTGSNGGYNISDSLANVAAGADGLVNGATAGTSPASAAVTAKVAFGAKAADDKVEGSKADVVITTVKYDDIDGKEAFDATKGEGITLVKADDKAAGNAEIVIDATAHAALGTAADAFAVDKADDAFSTLTGVSYKFIATAKDDVLTVGNDIVVVNAGAGDDNVTATFGGTGIAKDGTLKLDLGSGNDTLTLNVAANDFDLGTDGTTPTPNANIVLNGGTGTDTLKFTTSGEGIKAIDFMGDDQIQGFEKIDLSGSGIGSTVANQFTLGLSHQTEKFTIDAKADSAQFVQIFSGQNADTINLGTQTTAKITFGKDTIGAMDSITGFGAGDTIQVRSIAGMAVAADVKDSIASGKLTLTSAATTLKAALAEADKAADATGEAVAFVLGDNSYIFVQNGDNDFVVELAGVKSLDNGIAISSATHGFDIAFGA